ncbi:hypothetical protein PIB30_100345 [Stylosanthes scabra]|uniref:Uncharacterized protein n=1 Tax=Stylosanthes scabra TaxID=79078 RepID=A0ABU6TZ38_9FABA|nr:hypothetical protein [Stylosanthes scabra]
MPRTVPSNGAVAGELNISNPNLDLLDFDSEIERTLRRARQVPTLWKNTQELPCDKWAEPAWLLRINQRAILS